ncbi:hypothetical protein V7S43_016672 [Phytophthora oleae]|uniref:Uncharacterized protein n=1 Tax=Phytophthora oleae TaxID=2107226 RepID=A0ABD3EV02_9STRA
MGFQMGPQGYGMMPPTQMQRMNPGAQGMPQQTEHGKHVLLFRACKYGKNKHKKKYSTVVTAVSHASFHASLSQIVKTKVDVPAKDAVGKAPKRVVAKVKKTTE